MKIFSKSKGQVIYIELRQFILNENQQLAVMGFDREEMPIEMQKVKNVDFEWLGKLAGIASPFCVQIETGLKRQDWNFETYPNPEILLITIKSVNNKNPDKRRYKKLF